MIKALVKYFIRHCPIPLTLGERIDRTTVRLIHHLCQDGEHCVDVGAHKGEITDQLLSASPSGHHYAFEPLPRFFALLSNKYKDHGVTVLPYALAEKTGLDTFHHVVSNPTYSGLKRRRYDRKDEEVMEIKVEVHRMDDCIPKDHRIRLIKIDVEGAELFVLRGASRILSSDRPYVIFEHGEGGADCYGYGPQEIWTLLDSASYDIYDLLTYERGDSQPLSMSAMQEAFDDGSRFYFIATPKAS